jgi:hypothetical protein
VPTLFGVVILIFSTAALNGCASRQPPIVEGLPVTSEQSVEVNGVLIHYFGLPDE